MATSNGQVKGAVTVNVMQQKIRAIVQKYITKDGAPFKKTLGSIPDIENMFMSLVHKESSFNSWAISPAFDKFNPKVPDRKIRDYLGSFLKNDSAVKSKWDTSNADERTNITFSCKHAIGLTQCTASYFLRGTKSNLQTWRPDLAGPLMVNIGEDPKAKVVGTSDDILDNSILAGCIVLETKFKASSTKNPFLIIGSYLGLPGVSDSAGSNTVTYAKDIITGSSYTAGNSDIGVRGSTINNNRIATGGATPNATASPNATPAKTLASGNNSGPPGC